MYVRRDYVQVKKSYLYGTVRYGTYILKEKKRLSSHNYFALIIYIFQRDAIVTERIILTMSTYKVNVKYSASRKLGLQIEEQSGRIHVSGIVEGSSLSYSNIQVGHAIISVDGTNVVGKSKEEFTDVVRTITHDFSIEAAEITTIEASKPTPSTKLGFKFVSHEGIPQVTHINEDSILKSSDLRVGHDILAVNGTCVKQSSFTTLLKECGDHITFDVILPNFKAICDKNFRMSCSPQTVPYLLEGAGVSEHKWQTIYSDITGELLPNSLKMSRSFTTFHAQMKGYVVGSTFLTGDMGDNRREKDAFKHLCATAAQNSNTVLISSNLVNKTNALLAPHGVMCEISYYLQNPSAKGKYIVQPLYVPNGLVFWHL